MEDKRIIHKSFEPIPSSDYIWNLLTKCGFKHPQYICSYQWNKVNCEKCLKHRDKWGDEE